MPPVPNQKSSLKADLGAVFTCWPWIVMFVMTVFIFTAHVVRGSSLNYLFSYYLDPGALRGFLGGLGLSGGGEAHGWRAVLDALGLLVRPDGSNAAGVALSLFFVAGSLIQIIGIVASKRLADRFGKKTVFLWGFGISTAATAATYWVGPHSIGLMAFLGILWPLAWGPTVPLLWVMIADVADFAEWKTTRRATGFMYAGILFALKAGLGLGGALSGWIIGAYGYVANASQTDQAILGIRLAASVYSALPYALGLLCLALYPIGKALDHQIQEELARRRQQYAAAKA